MQHAVHGLHQRDGDEADDHADEDDHDRLEHRRELLDPALELTVEVEAGHLELLVERAGLLADLEHLLRRAGEQLGGGQRLGEPAAFEHLDLRDLQALAEDDVGRRLGRGLHALRQRHAGLDHRREDAAEPLEDRVLDDALDHRDLRAPACPSPVARCRS